MNQLTFPMTRVGWFTDTALKISVSSGTYYRLRSQLLAISGWLFAKSYQLTANRGFYSAEIRSAADIAHGANAPATTNNAASSRK